MARRTGTASGSELDAVARRLAAIIGHGAQGEALARALAREGVRGRAGLKAPAVFARLPREAQSRVLYSPARSTPLAIAAEAAAEVARRLTFPAEGGGPPARFEVVPVGSVRRGAPRVKDIDLLVVAPAGIAPGRFERALAAAVLRPPRPGDRAAIADTYAAGARRRSLVLSWAGGQPAGAGAPPRRHLRVDLFLASAAEKPFALYHYTGPSQYNIRTRALAKRRGWLLNQYGVFDAASGQRVRGASGVRTERDLARFLGVTYRPPEARGGAAAAAAAPASTSGRPGR
jgi:DNA polymerase (family 10)